MSHLNRAFLSALYVGVLATSPLLLAQHADAPAAPAYKNLTVLKDVPADQIGPAMQFMTTSLGVECTFCHVQGKMDADDKGEKKTARQMITMTNEINKTHFNGRQQITCNSCHRGSARPVAIPPVLETDAMPAKPAAPAAAPAGTPPTAPQIIAKYTEALGGEANIRKVTSRVMKGNILTGGQQTPIEVLSSAPNKRVSITHMGTSDSFTAFDGTAGWMGNTGRPARAMSAQESASSALDSELYLSLRLTELYPQMRRGRPETINGVECEVLNGQNAGHPPVRLYFDKTSGLLVRMVRYSETPLGRMPTQIDYADYRDVDGVKTAFRWTLSRPNGRFTIQIADAKNNVPVDDARFAKPAAEVK